MNPGRSSSLCVGGSKDRCDLVAYKRVNAAVKPILSVPSLLPYHIFGLITP